MGLGRTPPPECATPTPPLTALTDTDCQNVLLDAVEPECSRPLLTASMRICSDVLVRRPTPESPTPAPLLTGRSDTDCQDALVGSIELESPRALLTTTMRNFSDVLVRTPTPECPTPAPPLTGRSDTDYQDALLGAIEP